MKDKIPPRAWFKVYLAGAAGLVVAGWSQADQLELELLTSGIPDKVPPFVNENEIPRRNENLKPMAKVLFNAFEAYKGVAKDLSLPQLFYARPGNYLDEVEFSVDSLRVLADPENKSTFGNKFKKALYRNDEPYASHARFSERNIDGVTNPNTSDNSTCLILGDPGCGMVEAIRNQFKIYKNDPTFEIYDAVLNNKLSEEDKKIVESLVKVQMDNFQNFMRRVGNGKPISSSYALVYFLIQNRGDIVKSEWDTTVALKLLARNEKEHFRYKAERAGAEALAKIILDEQSPQVSLNWLVENISADDEKAFYRGKGKDHRILEYANFMPAFKAGVIYHAWNIASLVAVMSPFLVRRTVDVYYIATQSGGADKRLLGGKDKTHSDISISQEAEAIAYLHAQYQV